MEKNELTKKNENNTDKLKKPYLLWFFGVCLFLAPFGNVIISFSSGQVKNWYEPDLFFRMLSSIPYYDILLMSLISLSGLLLLIQKKLSWALSIITLSICLISNILKFTVFSEAYEHQSLFIEYQLGLGLLVTALGLILFYYWRFPYLDRRDKWFKPAAQRATVQIDTQIIIEAVVELNSQAKSLTTEFPVVIESISNSGAKLKFESTENPFQVGNFYLIFLDLKLEFKIVLREGSVLRIAFMNMTHDTTEKINQFVENNQNLK